MIPDFPLSVSFAEAAKLLSVSPNTVRRHAKDGRLRTIRLGRRRVVPFDALRELLRPGTAGESFRVK
jgi:excisionase family DNA binding protein